MSDESDDENITLNPKEATPAVVASDSATFALTDRGLVYGWGTFKGESGIFGFSPNAKTQSKPILIPALQDVVKLVKLAAGDDHVLALKADGSVLAWGSGERSQLGRRILPRRKLDSLLPRQVGFRKGIVDIGTGANHSFAVHHNGKVYGWGVNNSGQAGIPSGAGEGGANILHPTEVLNLQKFGKIIQIDGGNDHSLAVTENGECFVWGRTDNNSTGLETSDLPSEGVIYGYNRPNILTVPTRIPGLDANFAAAGAEHNIVITKDGKAYSWGFNDSHRTGHAGNEDDVLTPRLLNGKSIREKELVWAGAGSAFSVLAAIQMHTPLPNGLSGGTSS